jgi:uncharacterized protein YbjT (DUF2867 family)
MSAKKTILVTGATGKQGGAAARALLAGGWPVRGLTRDASKPAAQALAQAGAQVVVGDMKDAASMAPALDGVYGVFSVQNTWEHGAASEVQQGKLLVDLAIDAGVQHFVYSSVAAADQQTNLPHFDSKWELEVYLQSTGLPCTVFRPVFFMDNLLSPDNLAAIQGGTLTVALHPDTRLQMVAVHDIGAFVALAFDHPDQWLGRTLELAGDDLTMTDYAARLTQATGHPVAFAEMDIEQLRAFSAEYAMMCEWFIAHGYTVDIAALRQEYPPLLDFATWASGITWS